MMKKIGIRFSDNDFYNTLQGFMRVLADGLFWNHHDLAEQLTKARIVELFNSMSPSLYLLYQNAYRDVGYQFDAKQYLQIAEDNVYLDDEVDEYLTYLHDVIGGNGEFQYFDLEATLQNEMTGQRLDPVIVTI